MKYCFSKLYINTNIFLRFFKKFFNNITLSFDNIILFYYNIALFFNNIILLLSEYCILILSKIIFSFDIYKLF